MNSNNLDTFNSARALEVFAPPEMVWDWLSRVELWQDWHPEISSSRWLGAAGTNGAFRLRVRGVVGVSGRIELWEKQHRLAWVAGFWATTWRQSFSIDGDFRRTSVVVEGSLQGGMIAAPVFRSLVCGQLVRLNELWLGALKTQLESEKFRASQRLSGA